MNTRAFSVLMMGLSILGVSALPRAYSQSFVNFESPHVNPLSMTPDGSRLLAVNTADNRLEVFALASSGPMKAGSVPVGLDPVTVRARTNTEAWVVNHLSDSISIVDLSSMRVVNTLNVGDEPTDVVFAGARSRAFVCLSQVNQIKVYDPVSLALINTIAVQGEDPRALATDGSNVYAAIFESGTDTTILPFQTVSNAALNPYPGDPNPPPNSGNLFNPPKNPANPNPPAVSLIVKKNGANWMDDNDGVWTSAVTWNMHGHDVAIINANSLAVSYVNSLMNANMHIAVKPNGTVTVVGTDAINQVRFEPNVKGIFVRVKGASFPAGGGAASVTDLNPHLDYSTPNVPMVVREQSIGDPRGIAWGSTHGYITGMGSNNLIVVDDNFGRVARVGVGQGPTGVCVDAARGLIYALNKFDASLSVINQSSLTVSTTVSMHDSTPAAIKQGRPFLYDTHRTSGLGQASCASCHIDGRMDQLAWDLGDPSGNVKPFNQTCQLGGACENWHPMKGPMATQTLFGIVGTEPLHWRGDRENLAAFNGAFVGLMGADGPLSGPEMAAFTSFVATLRFPPQPNRNFNNSLKTTFPNTGNPQIGESRFLNQPIDGGVLTCVSCHAMPTGTNGQITPAQALQDTQSVKIPQLRNMYEKTGLFKIGAGSINNDRGFGFIKDGTVDTLFEFLKFSGFNYNVNPQPPTPADQQRRDIEAFLLSFPTGTHAAVGVQTTVLDGTNVPAAQMTVINNMIGQANLNVVGLVVKGRQAGGERGYSYIGGNNFQSDRAAETISDSALLASAVNGGELTYTVVPAGSQTRIGIDRDLDGSFDRDELDSCSDPANPLVTPANVCKSDVTNDHLVNVNDLLAVINNWGSAGSPGFVMGDITGGGPPGNCGDGLVNVNDLLAVINAWGPCP